MKVAPVANVPQQADRPSIRAIRMNVNATPGVIRQAAVPEPEPEPLANSNTNEAAADEATKPLSPQFAALAKQRRALQVKEREIADREKALQERSPTQDGAIDVARLKSDPLGVLLEQGVTYDQLTEAILNNQSGNGPELQALKAEIAALKEGVDKRLSEKDAQAEQAVLAEMRREAEKLAQSEDNAFQLVRETRSIPQVMELIEKTYRKNGEVLEVREAMQLVEDELIAESLKLAGLDKVQQRLKPEPTAPAQPQQRPPIRTLTNSLTANAPLGRRERALLAFAGQLKK